MAFAQRILVVTDFSEHARAAFAPARDLARQFGAEVLVLHVHDRNVPQPAAKGTRLLSEAEADAALDARLDALAATELADLGATTHLIDSRDVPGAICRFAADQGVDLLIIATQGQTGLKRLLLGSVAEAVIRSACCPVLTVRATKSEAT
jgi:nucleotide-binding universal stress UspA family protein